MENQYFPKVIQVIPTNDFLVYVYFSDGSIKCLDMKETIKKGVFLPLQDIELFKSSVTVLNDTVAWDISNNHDPSDCLDLDPFVIYELPNVKESDFIEQIA